MRAGRAAAALFFWLGSGAAWAQADRLIAACPPFASERTAIPPGARIVGRLPARDLPLWDATVSLGTPEDVGTDRVLAEQERDDETWSAAGAATYVWDVRPGPLPLMLACRYGATSADSLGVSDAAPLLLIPLPFAMRGECAVVHQAPSADRRAHPLREAVCRAVPGP